VGDVLNLDGKRLRVVQAATHGVVSTETTLTFAQRGDLVEAHYSGGTIVVGRLLGRVTATGVTFCYIQVDVDGHTDAGSSVGTIDTLPDGRMRLTESFQWLTRPDSGTNLFEEIE
jgi:hypothetical protein